MTARAVVRTEKRIKNKTSEKIKEGIISLNPSFAINGSLNSFSLSSPLWVQDFF
jgi:hypothetical protein